MSWSDARPAGLAADLWAPVRPSQSTLGELGLPDGNEVYGIDGHLLGWEAAAEVVDDAGELWLRCALQFPHTGLWPIVDRRWPIQAERRWHKPLADDGRPFWLDPYAVPSDAYDAVNVADRREYFESPGEEPGSYVSLMREFGLLETGMVLAQASTLPADPLSALVAPRGAKRLSLMACRRPADAVLMLDFGIPNDDATPGIFAGVLRSWEERFGLVPVMLNPAWTSFQVVAPPTTELEAERLAAEVFSFANDSAIQGGFQVTGGARQMVTQREWLIWWD
ncbi:MULTISPECIES: DUF4253 domain-containing protein [unclassified Nocardioides]|uniref:DUF4253 domain-containing protein n=1 Tax=unclassified Nocardioides TaxID=2615069 RepID=UPI0007036A5C|nr:MULTISPECIES: DUF4253 domain-containing protein [unclassified Nocardioides]KRC46539.1 hypothetical protein ASE19_22265 [Nocardioides sp. Root79]KRC69882.1 hypothetical protein ASE20_15115 [Nocardioides sp. Root240]